MRCILNNQNCCLYNNFCNISQKFQITVLYLLGGVLIGVCTKFQVDTFENITLWTSAPKFTVCFRVEDEETNCEFGSASTQ